MLYDVRTYECLPGTLMMHLEIYEKYGKAPQSRALGTPLGYLIGETGNPNRYIHIWVYKNAADREERRNNMKADPEWQNYLKSSREAGYLIRQENQLMQNVDFYPHSMP